ncbi:transcriptional regulator GutM [Pseudarthrobacter sp. CC4]|uniref:transcriptional regulator GutM n=1 Tax=Pseudarthrobacter sp. CC4 TaxID=3029190 RepID=UPI003BA33CF9
MNTEFALLLGGALVLGALLSWAQQRAYARTVRRMADQYSGQPVALVSGRGKGFVRGAIVVLAVDERSRRVVAAQAMKGSTVFARFRPHADLLGPLSSATARAHSALMDKALQEAQKQYKQLSSKPLSQKTA